MSRYISIIERLFHMSIGNFLRRGKRSKEVMRGWFDLMVYLNQIIRLQRMTSMTTGSTKARRKGLPSASVTARMVNA